MEINNNYEREVQEFFQICERVNALLKEKNKFGVDTGEQKCQNVIV